jgi:hypothetical protein
MYKKILSDPLVIPVGVSVVAEDLLRKLLDRNPATRLGANGAQDIKVHPFFQDVDWKRLYAKKYNPPFRPNVVSSNIINHRYQLRILQILMMNLQMSFQLIQSRTPRIYPRQFNSNSKALVTKHTTYLVRLLVVWLIVWELWEYLIGPVTCLVYKSLRTPSKICGKFFQYDC